MDHCRFDALRKEAKAKAARESEECRAQAERLQRIEHHAKEQAALKEQAIQQRLAEGSQDAGACAALLVPRVVSRIAHSPLDAGVLSWEDVTDFMRYTWKCSHLDRDREVVPELRRHLSERYASQFSVKFKNYGPWKEMAWKTK